MADEKQIEIPRDSNLHNDGVTKDIEAFLLELFNRDKAETYHIKDLTQLVLRQFRAKYGDSLDTHVVWAIQLLWFNNKIKKVLPSTFEHAEGPDPVYSERETGHAEPGEEARRAYNVHTKAAMGRFGSKSEFNKELAKTELSVKMLKNMGKNEQQVKDTLENSSGTQFDPTILKVALKKVFRHAQVQD